MPPWRAGQSARSLVNLCPAMSLHGLERFEHGVGVPCDFDLGKDLADHAPGIDDEGGSLNAHVFLAVHALLFPDAESRTDLFLGIGQERERQPMLLDELAVGLDAIGTDTDHPRAGLLVVRERVAKGTGLLGAA